MMRWVLAILLLIGVALTFETGERNRLQPPHTAKILTIEDSIPVRAVVSGPLRQAGDTTFVLMHGFGESLLSWRPVFDRLAQSHRTIAFDLPGFGASGKPAADYSLDRMVGWIRAILAQAAPGKVLLIGHSMGGELSAAYALAYPQDVTALVLIAPAGLDVGLGGMMDSVTARKALLIGWWEAARSFLLPIHDPAWLEEPPALAAYEPTIDRRFRDATSRIITTFDFQALRDQLPRITQPVLLVWGSLDPVIPRGTGEHFRDQLPCALLVELSDALHRPQVERPEAFLALIAPFLERPACPTHSTGTRRESNGSADPQPRRAAAPSRDAPG